MSSVNNSQAAPGSGSAAGSTSSRLPVHYGSREVAERSGHGRMGNAILVHPNYRHASGGHQLQPVNPARYHHHSQISRSLIWQPGSSVGPSLNHGGLSQPQPHFENYNVIPPDCRTHNQVGPAPPGGPSILGRYLGNLQESSVHPTYHHASGGHQFQWGNPARHHHHSQISRPPIWQPGSSVGPLLNYYGESQPQPHFVNNNVIPPHCLTHNQVGPAPPGEPSILGRYLGNLRESPVHPTYHHASGGHQFQWGNPARYHHHSQISRPPIWQPGSSVGPLLNYYGESQPQPHFVNNNVIPPHRLTHNQVGPAPPGEPSILGRYLGNLRESPVHPTYHHANGGHQFQWGNPARYHHHSQISRPPIWQPGSSVGPLLNHYGESQPQRHFVNNNVISAHRLAHNQVGRDPPRGSLDGQNLGNVRESPASSSLPAPGSPHTGSLSIGGPIGPHGANIAGGLHGHMNDLAPRMGSSGGLEDGNAGSPILVVGSPQHGPPMLSNGTWLPARMAVDFYSPQLEY